MVVGMSVSTLTTSRNNNLYGSTHLWRRHFGLMRKSHGIFGVERHCLWHDSLQSISLIGQRDLPRQRNMKVEAGWLFKGGDQDLDPSSERSDSANEDVLIFFYQLDLATRVQYALNLEQYEIAKQLRTKLTEVETEVIRLQETKSGSASKSEAQDKAISILCLRADLQNAIECENYALASELRDSISKLEAESLAASVKAQTYKNAEFSFRLGQKVKHRKFGLVIVGYRAVICGMDPICCESSLWMETAHVEKLTRGPDQPFYQVLVDVRADPNLLVTYVAEENLLMLDQPDTDRFDHPYVSFLFYGTDAAGDFIPVKQLREKYDRPRHELPYDPQDEKSGEDS